MKRGLLCLIALLMLAGCAAGTGGSDPAKPDNGEKKPQEQTAFKTLTIETNLTNPEARDDSYLVYLLTPGTKETEPGEATYGYSAGSMETDGDGRVVLELEYNWDIRSLIESESSTKKNHLQLIVATKEDIYLRNPLNQETFLEFVKTSDGSGGYDYYSPVESVRVDITDKYPDGVLSLTFQDATFVIKLQFDEPPETSYEVCIHQPSDTAEDGISAYRIGRICRSDQYWDTPFFKDDQMQNWSGTIIVNDFDTNQRIEYEGYPMQVTFDENGRCLQGDIVTVRMP